MQSPDVSEPGPPQHLVPDNVATPARHRTGRPCDASGAGEYDDFNADNPERWGDYSGAAVDPDDDETFWVSNEICQTAATGAGNDADWGTRIAQMGVVVPVELMSFSIE